MISGRTLVPAATIAAGVVLLFTVRDVLLPFVLAAVMAFLLNPMVRFFEVRGFRRQAIVILLYLVLAGLAAVGLFVVLPILLEEASKAAAQMPQYVAQGEAVFRQLEEAARRRVTADPRLPLGDIPWLQHWLLNERLLAYVGEHGKSLPDAILNLMPTFASGLLPLLELTFLVPFIAFFFMIQGAGLREGLLRLVPARYVEMCLSVTVEIDNTLGRYVRGVCLQACFAAGVAFTGFWLIGLDYAPQIALMVGLANMMPYVGPVVGGVLGSAVAIFQWGTFAGVMGVIGVCAAVRFLEDWFIQPLIVQNAVHLHPVWLLFSLMAGAHLWGFWGLLFGPPAACTVKALLQVIWEWYRSEYGMRFTPKAPEAARIPLI